MMLKITSGYPSHSISTGKETAVFIAPTIGSSYSVILLPLFVRGNINFCIYYITLSKASQELSSISHLNHSEGVYIINANHCISPTRSVVYHQAAGKYTLARDEIQGRLAALDDIHDCVVMIYQACGLDKQKQNICLQTNVLFLLAGAGGFEPATHGFGDRYSTS